MKENHVKKNKLQQLFCKHHYINYRNIYGDEINWSGGKRTIYKCIKCGKKKWIEEYILHGEITYL